MPEPDGYRLTDFRAPVPATLSGAEVLSTEQLQALIQTEAPLLIDVMPAPRKPRETSLWISPKRDNIPGSHWLANTGYGELSDEFANFFEQELMMLTGGNPGRRLVFYCEADCWMSWNAAKRALALGYQNVAWYPRGTDGWKAAGLPLNKSEPAPMPDFIPVTDGSKQAVPLKTLASVVD